MRDQDAANFDAANGTAMHIAPRRRAATVALLLVACFLPRAVAAWQWDVLWGDTLHYFNASVALEQGDFKRGFAEFGLNIYPLMLIAIRRLGVDWQVAGKWFSVLAATLAVVPIWAWLRRMFDDRTALLACLVYALHGKLIAISPLIIRDQTFWFLLATTLYFLWRAACEARVAFYLAAGAALTLAAYTRTEGWLLLVPLLGWTACRWFGATGCTNGRMTRMRLALGTAACLAVLPVSLAVVNATWLREQPRWELLREDHWQIVLNLWTAGESAKTAENLDPLTPPPVAIKATAAASPGVAPPQYVSDRTPPPSIVLPPAVPREKSLSPWVLTFKLLERLAKGLTWVGSVLLLIGIASGWRTFLRPEHLTLLAMNVMLLIVSGIRYRSAGLDLRYFMPLVIVGLPWMARGAEVLVAGVLGLVERLVEVQPAPRRGLAGFVVAVLIVCSLLDAPMSAAVNMRRHAALGRWMREQIAAAPALAGNLDDQSLDIFYAGGNRVGYITPRDCLLMPPPNALAGRTADFLVLWNSDDLTREQLSLVQDRVTRYCGYRRVPPGELPVGAGEDEVMVFSRN